MMCSVVAVLTQWRIVGDDGRGDALAFHCSSPDGSYYSLSYGISELARFLWARDLEKDLI